MWESLFSLKWFNGQDMVRYILTDNPNEQKINEKLILFIVLPQCSIISIEYVMFCLTDYKRYNFVSMETQKQK